MTTPSPTLLELIDFLEAQKVKIIEDLEKLYELQVQYAKEELPKEDNPRVVHKLKGPGPIRKIGE